MGGAEIFDLYFELSNSVSRIFDGHCRRIPLTEMECFFRFKRLAINPLEFETFCEMDAAFCAETNLQIEAERAKLQDQNKRA